MAIVESLEPTPEGRRRIGLKNPANREPIGEITVANADDVNAAIARARNAQAGWAAKTPKERAQIIEKAVQILIDKQEKVIEVIRRETGKTRVDTLTIEIISVCDFINYWTGQAPKQLADETVKLHGFMRPLKKAQVIYKPIGVVGIITPWNGPFVLAMNGTLQALLAGNVVILKPSEMTPHSSGMVVKILHEAGVPQDVLQVLHGDGETGAALVNGDIDKIAFTGSVATGKKISAACAERLIPVSLELGGKDAALVLEDANIERAANGILTMGMLNTGQVCLGIERVYVVEKVYDEFIAKLEEKAKAVRVGPGDDTDIGAIFTEMQMKIIETHVEDAREKGATILVGGSSKKEKGLFFQPTIITDVTHDMDVMSKETFGPVLGVMKVRDEDHAIEMANDSDYGLSGSVWTKDPEAVLRVARRLHTGSVMQGDAASVYGIPEVPFGGRKDSGLGQIHGAKGLRAFTYPTPVIFDRWGKDTEDVWFPLTSKTADTLEKAIKFLFGGPIRKLLR